MYAQYMIAKVILPSLELRRHVLLLKYSTGIAYFNKHLFVFQSIFKRLSILLSQLKPISQIFFELQPTKV